MTAIGIGPNTLRWSDFNGIAYLHGIQFSRAVATHPIELLKSRLVLGLLHATGAPEINREERQKRRGDRYQSGRKHKTNVVTDRILSTADVA